MCFKQQLGSSCEGGGVTQILVNATGGVVQISNLIMEGSVTFSNLELPFDRPPSPNNKCRVTPLQVHINKNQWGPFGPQVP